MKIKLAGYNLDKELINCIQGIPKEAITPETLTAGYARISRSPLPVDQLRKQAINDVAKARQSNEKILYGYGHSSIAENAVLNFDVMGISRLAIEAIEKHRLNSYLEKSQRYQQLNNEFTTPLEMLDYKCIRKFKRLVKFQNDAYEDILQALKKFYTKSAKKRTQVLQLENKAKEDARYVTSLAYHGQLGMTINARNLEYMINTLLEHPLREVKEIGNALYNESVSLIPSLVRKKLIHHNSLMLHSDLNLVVKNLTKSKKNGNPAQYEKAPQLIHWTFNGDTIMTAVILFNTTNHCFLSCYDIAKQFSLEEKTKLFKSVLRNVGIHDVIPRIFETITFTFDLVTSATCYAQLKRHRMAMLIPKPYDVSLDVTMPESFKEVDMVGRFNEVIRASEDLYQEIVKKNQNVAEYCLTQAHRRRAMMKLNARELYHFARLRMDKHAQWDIRQLAKRMVTAAQTELPLTMMMACGKDEYQKLLNFVYHP